MKDGTSRLNSAWLLHNFREAREQIDALIEDVETGTMSADLEESQAFWRNVYLHMNAAWNGALLDNSVWNSSYEEFNLLWRFPLRDFEDLHPDWINPGYGDE
jgi:hypothetical protein